MDVLISKMVKINTDGQVPVVTSRGRRNSNFVRHHRSHFRKNHGGSGRRESSSSSTSTSSQIEAITELLEKLENLKAAAHSEGSTQVCLDKDTYEEVLDILEDFVEELEEAEEPSSDESNPKKRRHRKARLHHLGNKSHHHNAVSRFGKSHHHSNRRRFFSP